MGVSLARINHAMEKFDELLPGWRDQDPEVWYLRRSRIPSRRRPGLAVCYADLREVFETFTRDGIPLPWGGKPQSRKVIEPKPKPEPKPPKKATTKRKPAAKKKATSKRAKK